MSRKYDFYNNLKLSQVRWYLLAIALMGCTIVGFVDNPLRWFAVFALLLIGIILFFVHYIFEHIVSMKDDYSQITSYIQLYHRVGGSVSLPGSRGYAASPDFVNFVLDMIDTLQPKVIVEASCGLSTVAISEYLLKKGLDTRHIALEHDAYYRNLCLQKVRNPHSDIIHAPLVTHTINNQSWKWYDTSALDIKTVDVLIVDGPPAYLQKDSRYPALPLLSDKMHKDSVILMDDADRMQERRIVQKWAAEYNMKAEWLFAEKGIGKLTYE